MPLAIEMKKARGGFIVADVMLNAERSLNALNQEMAKELRARINEWQNDKNVCAVFLRGAGERAFCAGGDIRGIYRAISIGDFAAADSYFADEYALDFALHYFSKPLICWGGGIAMGGGVGILQGANCRVVTETSRLAMPEVHIGFFPDVAAMWFLSRAPQSAGLFLALTGCEINGADAKFMGLADRLIKNDRRDSVLNSFLELNWRDDIMHNRRIAFDFMKKEESLMPAESPLNIADAANEINRCCDDWNLDGILSAIRESNSGWIKSAASRLDYASPLAIALAHRYYFRARHFSLRETFIADYSLAMACLRTREFAEGVRAMVIDKDKKPRWEFSQINQAACSRAMQLLSFDGGESARRFADSLLNIQK